MAEMSLLVLLLGGRHVDPSSSSLPYHDVRLDRGTCRPVEPPDRHLRPRATAGMESSQLVVELPHIPEAAAGMCCIPGPAQGLVSRSTVALGPGEAAHCHHRLVGSVEGRLRERTGEQLAESCGSGRWGLVPRPGQERGTVGNPTSCRVGDGSWGCVQLARPRIRYSRKQPFQN